MSGYNFAREGREGGANNVHGGEGGARRGGAGAGNFRGGSGR